MLSILFFNENVCQLKARCGGIHKHYQMPQNEQLKMTVICYKFAGARIGNLQNKMLPVMS